MNYHSLTIFIIGLALQQTPSNAADITLGGDAVMDCDATLDGQILSGDADKLRTIAIEKGWRGISNWLTQRGKTICLNSPGGSFLEGIKIADVIVEFGLKTAIGSEKLCESACSIAFMAGGLWGPEDLYFTNRRLHPRGRLGFHAPGIVVPEGDYNSKSVAEAYEVAIQSTREILKFRRDRPDRIPEDLLIEMLGTPPSDMFYIDTVTKAVMWKIEITPVGNPSFDRREAAINACSNGAGWMEPNPSFAGRDFIRGVERKDGKITVLGPTGGFLGEGTYGCNVVYGKDSSGEFVVSMDFPSGTAPLIKDFEKVYLFAPDLPLAELPLRRDWSAKQIIEYLAGTLPPARPAVYEATVLRPSVAIAPPAQGAPGASIPAFATEADEVSMALDRDTRREVQRRLSLIGFDTKGVDGALGPNSRAAIQAWQQSNGFPVSGYLNQAQKIALFSDSQEPYGEWKKKQARTPKKRRVKVCQRGPLGLLVNCRTEWR
ncbi:hypothetical protein ROE7235_03864 [Roseibaca ekhonensis]|uniref:Peptidoglycan binding-like domain-containing protein n=1 Tax=Roseinatronobacter ekhonensis TaxID=254356 RepID=A0A3B0ME33_9RHOB|nr:peptidoglycan-binding protein [Roseibaca ekhonensis]SUZ34082.1 hypothetical protein ROE7235_03864 [Roseibaca ekhonensis]